MVSWILAIFTLLLFCLSCRFFAKAIVTPIPFYNHQFSKTALRLEKFYKVTSWGILTGLFLMGLVYAYAEIYFTYQA